MVPTDTAEVARGRGFESHCCTEVIVKLAWGPNKLSPGTWRFGSANKELLSNRLFCFRFLLVLIFLTIFFLLVIPYSFCISLFSVFF